MSITGEQLWVIAYDSPSNKRRRKLAKMLEGYGERLQWSVFECRLQPHQLRQLRDGLMGIATGEDSVRLWVVPQRAPAAEQLGKPVETQVWEVKVI
jgi:CRISPR-associated protein Cas2